jgi:hypothetical protein
VIARTNTDKETIRRKIKDLQLKAPR